jgi:hypothetical protein
MILFHTLHRFLPVRKRYPVDVVNKMYCNFWVVVWFIVFFASHNLNVSGEQVAEEESRDGDTERQISLSKSLIWGPGLSSDIVLPARYFFIQTVDTDGNKYE